MQPIYRRILSVVILVAGLVWIFFSADKTGASTAGKIPAPQQGFLAPAISLSTPKGETYSLAELKGEAVLVNIWATWCPPCRAEMPAIEKVYEENKSKGFVVLSVNATAQDNPLDIAPFLTEYGITFPVVLDETGEVSTRYELRSLPSSYFVDRDGMISAIVIGGMSEAQLITNVQEILK